ncbi:MAG: MBL fold metallo-hydrolase [Candidatus Kapaibacterium sp.]
MEAEQKPFVIVLGIAQDGGVPHIATRSSAWNNRPERRHAASLGIVDPTSNQRWIIEATPDVKEQLHQLDEAAPLHSLPAGFLSGIALTHAHVGHYLGLAFLGKEMMNAKKIPLYTMPKMGQFHSQNLPWCDLIANGNVLPHELQPNVPCQLNERITLTPLLVPHRDEQSETVGFRVQGPERSVLFIPDIDRWEDWDAWGTRVEEEIAQVDVAYLDGTFFDERELPGRDMGKIPHPTIRSSIERFAQLPESERKKIRFIHLNHSNPALHRDSLERNLVESTMATIAEEGEQIIL